MVLKSNGGKLPINEVADFKGFKREMWFSRNAMTNILSFSLVKSEYNITYDCWKKRYQLISKSS
jgi:hypothetical protein